jgi:uridine kinase
MTSAERIGQAVRSLQDRAQDRVIVVALDGHGGAGKSTLATAVADHVGAAIVHVDDFYRDLPDADRIALTPAEGVDRYFDWERIREEALTILMRREQARFRCFDWVAGGGLTGAITVEPREIVLVEGVYSARPEFDDLIDLRVLVEVAKEERARRREERHRTVSRDDVSGLDARWGAAEDLYFRTIRPRDAFDLVVSGRD